MTIKAWHFLREDKKLQFSPHKKVRAGQVLKVPGEPVLCLHGLHASVQPLDALSFAPGPIICRVEVGGIIVRGSDKLAGTERKVLWMADATETLRAFSRWCALEVVHLWDAPAVVIEYLKTGDESKRDAARDAAWAAARAAAWGAAWAAAWGAAWAAAWDAARAAARDAARDAARAAARDAARAAAWDAARAAAREKQNHKLASMLKQLHHA